MLTLSRLSRSSIAYYEKTANEAKQAAMDRQAAGGGLGEYYTEGDTRVPTWIVTGDASQVAELTGLTDAQVAGGFADGDQVSAWLDDGIAPNGATGRAFTTGSVHGFDLTFAAPKSVSLVRALSTDLNEKVVAEAHMRAVKAAMDYLHQHAGYTRVHNPLTGNKDLQRLPGLTAIAYQHETSRCGDPHLHTHVILPNRQARADGVLVSIDSKSLHHEAKAAGIVYQSVLRHELHAERGFEFTTVGEHSGMAEIAGITKGCIKAWSQRSTRLREWARDNLVVVDGEPTAAQLQAAQKATRPRKPESLAWADLKEQWRADARGLEIDRAAHTEARRAHRGASRDLMVRPRLAQMVAGIDKAAFTRADLVELVGAMLPYDAPGSPRELIEKIVDTVGIRVSAQRERHHREGHEHYTVDAIIREEERIFEMIDEQDARTRIDVRRDDLGDLSADQARAVGNIASSPYLVQPLQAPAGAGKTHSLKALRAGAHRGGKKVLVVAPTGKAVDEAMRDGAGDDGMTVAKALQMVEADQLRVDRRTVIVVDEASMLGTPELKKLLSCATVGRAKIVLVGDPYQLSPVKARGGMFEYLCDELPWSQRLSEVWRMRTVEERDASLALRSGHGNRLRKTIGWYRKEGRLHTGDPIAMAQDATTSYITARAEGKDAAIICDRWEIADAINRRLHGTYTDETKPGVRVARDQDVRVGDIIISRNNDPSITVTPGAEHRRGDRIDQVRNGNRWRVAMADPAKGQIAAERLTDNARVIFEGDYLKEHITLGYATTLHAAQGITVGSSTKQGACFTVLSDQATRAMAYVGMTRGKDENHTFIYQSTRGEADHEHTQIASGDQIHTLRRGNKYAAAHYFRMILANDDRVRPMHAEAERSERDELPDMVAELLTRNDDRRQARAAEWQKHKADDRRRQARHEAVERAISDSMASRARNRGRDEGYGLEL
ncbi:MobF family relaxase [[Mycobacterium] nativiensis]|uniref:MobF family relaxase n=1 Tax=[Mycobacterium] nativiensis TaxID=2855503 RepID=A0ABU5Y4M8_9MYCO|nr:MobF family relaxase [Mycolicibacter sp. MYC340]MEB3035143.1 MobF family relaxase [Mycolicibacter sp. MYC340]